MCGDQRLTLVSSPVAFHFVDISRVSGGTWRSVTQLGRLSSQAQVSSCLFSSVLGAFLSRCWGSSHRSSAFVASPLMTEPSSHPSWIYHHLLGSSMVNERATL